MEKVQSGNYKKKRKKKKIQTRERKKVLFLNYSQLFWMFLWIIGDYPGISWAILLLMVVDNVSVDLHHGNCNI
jgi:ABC-type xylose transport system permease subunit